MTNTRLTLGSLSLAGVPTDLGFELRCPRCGSGFLHSAGVRVFDRGEDAESTSVTTVKDGLNACHILPSKAVDNPSSRRHGIAIGFECEGCGDGIEMTLAQHKGNTPVAWRFAPAQQRD